MKEYGDATRDYLVDLDDVFLILTKMGAAGEDAGEADIDEDGVVTVDDLAIALQNQGMDLRAAIDRRCQIFGPDDPPGGGWDITLYCDCLEYWLGQAIDFGLLEPGDEEPCGGGGPGGDEPPDLPYGPGGQDCSAIPINEPVDCEAFAMCMANNAEGHGSPAFRCWWGRCSSPWRALSRS